MRRGAFEGLLVDATTRQITVHDPHNTYRPIEMSVSVHYNGVWMGDKMILNQQGAQGFYGVNDEIISSDHTVSGDKIWTSNVTILNGGRMTLTAPLITVVDGFSVEPGGSFVFGG